MKKRIWISLLFGLFLLIGYPSKAQAQTLIDIGPRGGYEVEQQSPIVGLGVRINSLSLPFIFNPSFDYYLNSENPEDADFQFNLDALFPFGNNNQVFAPYAGAGFALQYSSDDASENSTDFGFNGVGGALFNIEGSLRPFVQARVTIAGATYTNVTGGILLKL